MGVSYLFCYCNSLQSLRLRTFKVSIIGPLDALCRLQVIKSLLGVLIKPLVETISRRLKLLNVSFIVL